MLGGSFWLQHGKRIQKEDQKVDKGAAEDSGLREPGSYAIFSKPRSLGPHRRSQVQ